MTFTSALLLLLAMIALAALPSSSVALVVVRSATYGVRHGIAASLGIAIGDLLFVALAIAGLAAIAEAMGTFFAVLRYAAAAYLLWFGWSLIRGAAAPMDGLGANERSADLCISFVAGIGLTLGDVKAILFYAALFPVFVDPSTVTMTDVVLIVMITLVAVAGVKIGYAIAARRIATASQGWRYRRAARRAAGGLMIAAGGALALKT